MVGLVEEVSILKRVVYVAVGVTGPKAGRHKVSAKQEQILADPSQIDQQI